MTLQYDGGGNFRVEQVTPATAQQLGMAGVGGIGRWSFPSVSAYTATVADNGNAMSAFNSPLAYLSVTLPSATALNAGWTIAIANDNGKTAAVQVNATNGGNILYPGQRRQRDLAAAWPPAITSWRSCSSTASNFRVLQMTPATAASIGLAGGTCTRMAFPAVSTYTAGVARLRHRDLELQLADRRA